MKANNGHKEMDRVRANTNPELNEHIDERIRHQLVYYASRKEEIPARIEELDEEWDMDRWLLTQGPAVAFGGLALGITVNRKWFLLPGIVLPFLFLYGVHGWCPPLPLLRRYGVRTQREIDAEKYGMKFLRGDFETLKKAIEDAQRAIAVFKASTT